MNKLFWTNMYVCMPACLPFCIKDSSGSANTLCAVIEMREPLKLFYIRNKREFWLRKWIVLSCFWELPFLYLLTDLALEVDRKRKCLSRQRWNHCQKIWLWVDAICLRLDVEKKIWCFLKIELKRGSFHFS